MRTQTLYITFYLSLLILLPIFSIRAQSPAIQYSENPTFQNGQPFIPSIMAAFATGYRNEKSAKNASGYYHPEQSDHEHEGLHFSHPLFTESISPDTKLRFDYGYQYLKGKNRQSQLVAGGEYAFNRVFSIEVGLPYGFVNPSTGSSTSRIGNMEVSLKFANYAFEQSGILLGYGMEFGLPTGNEQAGIGSNHILELAPFFNAGLKKGNWEWTGFTTFGIPTRQPPGQEFETEFELNMASLYHINPRIQALIELNGSSVISGEMAGKESLYFLSPGFKIAPFPDEHIIAGLGLGLPVSQDAGTHFRTLFSIFYHIE